jgi:flavin-dependent thymidylate synthase
MSEEVIKWADQAMFRAAPMKRMRPTVYLLWATPDPLGAVAAMSRMYEGQPTYSLTEISDPHRMYYWEQMQKTHLQAPLESIKFHFFIEGVDRALTHQMVRQRTAVYAQESMRFAVKDDLVNESSRPLQVEPTDREPNDVMAQIWFGTLERIQAAYTQLVNMGMPAEDARGLLPHCTLTRLHYITDLRNLIEHAGNRLCTQAQFVWRYLFAGIVNAIGGHHGQFNGKDTNWQFQEISQSNFFRPVCYRLGHCPFMASFDRQCTIRERVNQGRFEEIHDTEWMLDPTAARRD